jgi:hypothetical protein
LGLKDLRPGWPEVVVVGLAGINFGHLWWTAVSFPGGCIMCPWWYPWHWDNLPVRLLLASSLLLAPLTASRLVAVALAAPMMFLICIVDRYAIRHTFQVGLEYMFALEAALAVAIVLVGCARLASTPRDLRVRRGLQASLGLAVFVATLGCLSVWRVRVDARVSRSGRRTPCPPLPS